MSDSVQSTSPRPFRLKRDDAPDIRFTGEKIAGVSSDESSGRWTELNLYRTTTGTYICERIGRTVWDGEHDRHDVEASSTELGVQEFFGSGWLSKDLYEAAGIDHVEDIV